MNIPHDRKLRCLVATMILFILLGATRPVNAEQPLIIEVSRCVDMKSAIERLTCYDELAYQARQATQVSRCVDMKSAIERLTCYDELAYQARQAIKASRCVDMKSAIERLTCYDELAYQAQKAKSKREAADLSEPESGSGSDAPVAIIEQESVAAETVIQSALEVEQVPVTDQTTKKTGRVTEENFGLPREKQDDEEDLVELHSTISKLKETMPGRYLITLENGQVWRQMVSERYRLRVGHHVRIYPTGWGKSFRLSAEGVKGFIQVERVR